MGLVKTGKFLVDERELQGVVVPDDLIAHIKHFDILVDLIVTEDGLILDGLKRLIVAQQLKFPRLRWRVLPITASESWEATIDVLLRQKYCELSTAIRAALGARLLPSAQRAARERMRLGGSKGGSRRGRANPRNSEKGGEPTSSPPLAARGGRAAKEVAQRVGISRKTLERFERIRRCDPYLTQEVLAGQLSIKAAHQLLRDSISESEDATVAFVDVSGEIEAVALERFVEELRRSLGRVKGRPLVRDPLTEDELYALALLGLGKGNDGISRDLGVSSGTLNRRLSRAYRKLGVAGRTEAVRLLGKVMRSHH